MRPSSPANYEASGKDFNFVLIEKENAPIKKETERLAMAKDSGKQFVSAAPSSGINKHYDRFCSAPAPVQMLQMTRSGKHLLCLIFRKLLNCENSRQQLSVSLSLLLSKYEAKKINFWNQSLPTQKRGWYP